MKYAKVKEFGVLHNNLNTKFKTPKNNRFKYDVSLRHLMNIEDRIKELAKKGFLVFSSFPVKWWDSEVYHDSYLAQKYSDGDLQWQKWAEECVESAAITPEDIVADLGCGTGAATQKILHKKPELVYAIEPAKAMLDVFKTKIQGQVRITQGSIDELAALERPVANKIISHGVFVAVKDKLEFLNKIYSYLPQNGLFVFTIEDWHSAFGGISLQESEIGCAEFVYEKTGQKMPITTSECPYFDFKKTKTLIEKAGADILEYKVKEQITSADRYVKAHQGLYSKFVLSAINEFYADKKIVLLAQHLFVTRKKAK